MKSFRKNKRGQFVIIAALLIAALTLSLVLSINQISLTRQRLRYQPVQEIVLSITSDLDRCLTHALSQATQKYRATQDTLAAQEEGNAFITKWTGAVIASYSNLGLRMSLKQETQGQTDISWTIDWNRQVGISQVYTQFNLDIDAYNFKGWVGRSGKFVTLKIDPGSIKLTAQTTTLTFEINQGKDEPQPVANLAPENLQIIANTTQQPNVPAAILSLTYIGQGKYDVTFNQALDTTTKAATLTVTTPQDRILVSAYTNAEAEPYITLQSQEDNVASANLGQIQYDTNMYSTLPALAIATTPGQHYLEYTPNAGYTFAQWKTTGSITVENASSPITVANVNGNGTVTAIYKRLTPVNALIQLNSRDAEDASPPNKGSIILDTKAYTLPNSASLPTGTYTLTYQPENASYKFVRWDSKGNTIPLNPYNQSTRVEVNGDGEVIAIYRLPATVPIQVHVNLQSVEASGSGQNNVGLIKLGETTYTLPNETTLPAGTYLLKYTPTNGYAFTQWVTIGNITVSNTTAIETQVTLNSDGTITAVYNGYTLQLRSREYPSQTLTNMGKIAFNTTLQPLPTSLNATPAGKYPIAYNPASTDYVFLYWETEGDVTPYTGNSNPTTLEVKGNGTLTAVYARTGTPPPSTPFTLTLASRQDNSATQNLGTIRLENTTYTLPNTTTTTNRPYTIEYTAADGYAFINWTITGNIQIQNPYSQTTVITPNGDGTITAYYTARTPPALFTVMLSSRDYSGVSVNLGSVVLAGSQYSLPWLVPGLAAGDYALQYVPVNSSYVFLWWEQSGSVIPANSNTSLTTLSILGDGNLTAVYRAVSTPPVQVNVNLKSTEADGAGTSNMGTIQLGETVYPLPNTTNVYTGTYFLKYTSAQGYIFSRWETSSNITVENAYSPETRVTVNGDGTITAVYRGFTVMLSSRDYSGVSVNLGSVVLAGSQYSLPWLVPGLAAGDYALQYVPVNSSYVFLWWEQSGSVIPWNFTANSTTVTVYGNGTLTAVYMLESETPPNPPPTGEWNTLYVDRGPVLVPPSMMSMHSGHIPSWASTGADKQVVIVNSPSTPMTIYLAKYVNITAYLGIDPSWNAKSIEIEFGFTYAGVYYKIGSQTTGVAADGVYHVMLDSATGQYPGVTGTVPEGSVFTLTCTVTFYEQPWGTFKLYYGPRGPSNVALF